MISTSRVDPAGSRGMFNKAKAFKGGPLSPAMRLMLLSCGNRNTQEQADELREMVAGFSDWDSFLRLTLKNRVFLTVCKNLTRLGDAMDQRTLSLLRARCERSRLNEMKLMAELIRISGRFDREGIRVISLKGPALGLTVYGDLSLRTSKDLDLLVPPGDLDAAEQALRRMGYRRIRSIAALTPRQRRYLLKSQHHFNYVSGAGVEVELHWKYDESFNVRFDEVWANRKPVTAFGARVMTLGDEDCFLFLMLHGSRHGWRRLRWLLDVYEIARKNALDWAAIRAAAQARGMTYMLEQTFCLLRMLFGLELPKGMDDLPIDRPDTARLVELALTLMASEDDLCDNLNHECHLVYKAYMLAWWRTPSERLRYMLAHFRPGPDDFSAVRIGDAFFWLYYAVRPALVLKRLIMGGAARAEAD